MTDVMNMQVHATLHFDDGYVVTISTPIFSRDIRNGFFIDDEITQHILRSAGEGLANVVEEKTLEEIHKGAENHFNNPPKENRNPFSDN